MSPASLRDVPSLPKTSLGGLLSAHLSWSPGWERSERYPACFAGPVLDSVRPKCPDLEPGLLVLAPLLVALVVALVACGS